MHNLHRYLLLGLIQGLTEFLPISSLAHLVFSQRLLGIDSPGVVLEG
ncbi:TPA: UDP pyrophosphate phosphatase, partial [Candidatus Micrarchaeota archaeon]|nr:UDP pyrophosphate phosphatase [Candidatus Micrarchaeota archaeon]